VSGARTHAPRRKGHKKTGNQREREKELPSVHLGAGKRPGTCRTCQPLAMVRDRSQTHTCALKDEAANGLKTLDNSQDQKYLVNACQEKKQPTRQLPQDTSVGNMGNWIFKSLIAFLLSVSDICDSQYFLKSLSFGSSTVPTACRGRIL
jgi:hypothetical protein